jgi:hypothetical protein
MENKNDPMDLMRGTREAMLGRSDLLMLIAMETGEQIAAWKIYRQALRDLPVNASPQIDENGQLTNVTWPTKPD